MKMRWMILGLIILPAHIFGTTIGFLIQHLSFRGTEIALYDYAHYNETILDNKSIIINRDWQTNNAVKKRFTDRFKKSFFDCETWEVMDEVIRKEKIDILYIIKPSLLKPRLANRRITNECKTVGHIVFQVQSQIQVDRLAHISGWLRDQYSRCSTHTVPHMVYLPNEQTDLRKKLNIPQDAIVFGRHGGYDSFNLPFVHEIIEKIAHQRKDIYFVLLNTQPFCSLLNVIHLPKITDLVRKTQFINTCDAMIHARRRGETFGLACAEFSIRNKPVITWFNSYERAHVDLLGNKGIYYSSPESLYRIFSQFKKEPQKNWDAYSEKFNPEAVMKQFDEVFIQPFI